ncbi:LacI family DNA-binding transcriptional regulator [Armatimonas sp.]|uniref:LacI family DNA-binding transcriptional regulator n=1 Tax=Armatimonas sp. TaxID=1872638 RepID=UPI00375164DF
MEETPVRRSVRLEDIAQEVGVARSEVSRVLNGRLRAGRSVGMEKQERIHQVAQELGYQPNKAAQNLAHGRTDTVGLLLQPGASYELSPHHHEIIGVLTSSLAEQGLHLLLHQWSPETTDSLVRLARARTCDLLVLTDLFCDDPRPALLREMRQPFVIRGSAPEPGMLAVGMDNQAVGRLAVETLMRYGHRQILFHNIGRRFMAGEGRYQGCRAACLEHGLDQTLHYEDQVWGEEGVYTLVRERFSQPNPPTAIFASDEFATIGALRALEELGKRVPEDVSLLTCLNARFMRRVLPHITTILTRQHEIATEVGRTVGRLLNGELLELKQHFLTPVLEERGSCAPPPA